MLGISSQQKLFLSQPGMFLVGGITWDSRTQVLLCQEQQTTTPVYTISLQRIASFRYLSIRDLAQAQVKPRPNYVRSSRLSLVPTSTFWVALTIPLGAYASFRLKRRSLPLFGAKKKSSKMWVVFFFFSFFFRFIGTPTEKTHFW